MFPAGDTSILKRKLVYWAGNFSVALFIDRNNYRYFDSSRDCIVAAGDAESRSIFPGFVFSSLKKICESKNDWLFGYITYDVKQESEPDAFEQVTAPVDGISFPVAHFFHPEHVVEIKEDQVIIHSTIDPEKIFTDIQAVELHHKKHSLKFLLQQRFAKNEYIATVNLIREHIANGDVYEVNLCQEFFSEQLDVDPCRLFTHLNEVNPAPFACFLKHGQHYLLCSSPERFLKKEGTKLISQPMKGTIARIKGGEDQAMIGQLKNDQKERAENVMIVDLVRNDLAKSAVPGSVKVEELFGIYSFPKVHQMISTVSATLKNEVHFTEALKHAFPMGSMTGAPKIMAMRLIDRYEKTKRGLFSGTVGFITPDSDFDFNVVIRSFLYNASAKYLSFQTGSAITYDSVPEKEYEECLLKAASLIETLETA